MNTTEKTINHHVNDEPHTESGKGGSKAGEFFRHFAHRAAMLVGSPWAFLAAVLTLVIWGICGPIFGFSDTWQLVINTGTTIVTFLMVFLIQSTQNRDARAIHLKLDELIRAQKSARNTLLDLEECTEEELATLEKEFRKLHERGERRTKKGTRADRTNS